MFRDKRLTSAKLSQWDVAARKSARQSLNENTLPGESQSLTVWVRNDSGNDRQRFECMALSDPIFDLALDGSVDLMFKAISSARDKTPIILIDDIAKNEFGRGVIHGLALAKAGSGSVSSTTATIGTNKLTPGSGDILLLSKPSASQDTLLPVVLGAPTAKFYLYTLLGPMTGSAANFASARIRKLDDSAEVSASSTVVNVLSMFSDQAVSQRGVCVEFNGVYYAIQAPCNGSASSAPTLTPGGLLPVNPVVVVF